MESILTSVKKMLGISKEYQHFDDDIIMHINSALFVLTQLGVGPSEGFIVEDANDEWTDFIGDAANLELVKSYVYLKVKVLFDPPLSSAAMEAVNRQIAEYEWRLNVAVD